MGDVAWLTSPLTSSVASLLGLAISIVGFVGTIIGLVVTYRQSRDAKSAAQAAAMAADEVRVRVNNFDAASEAFTATAAIKETQRHLRNSAWHSVVESYSSARAALTRLQALAIALNEQEREEISIMLADISSVCRQIDKTVAGSEPKLNRAKVLEKCRDYEEFLERTTIQIQRAST